MTLELCIPARNEAKTIVQALRLLSAGMPTSYDWTITVAENGSTDGTADVVERAALPRVRVVRIEEAGKGRAVRTIAQSSSADLFGYMDADLSVDPSEIPMLLEELRNGANIAAGSRLLTSSRVDRSVLRTLSSRLFSFASRLFLSLPVRDTQCGCKFMDQTGLACLRQTQEDGWFFDLEFLALACRSGVRVVECPIQWTEVRFPERTSQLHMFFDSFRGFQAIFRIKGRLSRM